MDDFQARALKSLRERHESQIRESAERIRDHIEYVLAQLDAGRSDTVTLYAEGIEVCARRIVNRAASLKAIGEAAGILADTPSKILGGEPGTRRSRADETGPF